MSLEPHLRDAVQAFAKALQNDEGLAADILTRIIIPTIRKYQDKVGAGIEDSATDLLATFKSKVAREFFDVAQKWTIPTRDEPILFPNGCRFLYTLGRSTFVVVEQGPGPKGLLLDPVLFDDDYIDGIPRRFSLSIPYSLFIFQFKNDLMNNTGDRLVNFAHAWRPAPLQSITDVIYHPYLPNIHQNLNVCRGEFQDHRTNSAQTNQPNGNISVLTNELILDFWSSRFNSDLDQMWREKSLIPEIATVEKWAENTRDDGLFALNIRLKPHKTLGEFLKELLKAAEDEEPGYEGLKKRLNDTIEETSNELFHKIVNYLRKTKFDKFYPKEISQFLALALDPISEQIVNLADDIEQRFQKMNSAQEPIGWEPRGDYWS